MKNFVGVFPANHMNKFINFKSMICEKSGKYPFLIVNTDSSDKDGTHLWSILNIKPKIDLLFFYYLLGIDRLKNFIIQDDESVIQKMLFGIEKMTKTGSKTTLLKIKFSMNMC